MRIILHIEDTKSDLEKIQKIFKTYFNIENSKKLDNFSSNLNTNPEAVFFSENFDILLLQTDNVQDAKRLIKKHRNKIIH